MFEALMRLLRRLGRLVLSAKRAGREDWRSAADEEFASLGLALRTSEPTQGGTLPTADAMAQISVLLADSKVQQLLGLFSQLQVSAPDAPTDPLTV